MLRKSVIFEKASKLHIAAFKECRVPLGSAMMIIRGT